MNRSRPENHLDTFPDPKLHDAASALQPAHPFDDVPPRGERVLSEVFHTEETVSAIDLDVESRVTVSVDGRETTFALRSTGDTVLDAALRQGVDAPYSCAGGACGTCRAKVLLGSAVMDQDHALDDEERAAGYVLTCQAHPVSEELCVDYDA